MSDLQKYIAKRKGVDKTFASTYSRGYQNFKKVALALGKNLRIAIR